MKYTTQVQDDQTIQHFTFGNSSELKSKNSKGSGSGGLHVKKKRESQQRHILLILGGICVYSMCSVGCTIFIISILTKKKGKKEITSKKKKEKGRLMMIPCVVINRFQLSRRHVYHTVSCFLNEQYILFKV